MDAASKALAEAPPNDDRTWAARADSSGIAITTLYNRWRGRPSIQKKAEGQQYLTVEEEKALVAFLLLMSSFGQPVRIKYIPTLAFSIARRRSPASRPNKPPSKNWAQAFGKRHPELKSKRVRSIDWRRHEIHIYDKITEWFGVIGKVLRDPAILPENVYNMDETGVMLSMLGSVKVLPCDVSVFAPLKTAYRDQVERLNRSGIHTIAKEHFTYLYAPAREKALTKRNIIAGWAATGLFPFSPERVLRNTPKPPADLVVSVANEVGSSSQSDVPLTPATPVTPVTAEGLTVLHDLIKRDAGAPDEASKQRLERRVQKLVSAAKISVAKQSLLQDHNRLLCNINNEATVRRTTRSLVLSDGKGEGKVMRWEDLQRARAERAARETVAKEKGKGKRGRKRKTPAQEVEEESMPLEVEAGPSRSRSRPRGKVSKKSRVKEPAPWRAPVATMY
ncbi:hypothetical protein CUC08_Gglean002374 [Alternaria sp. MG1]|nr:hypothetical protein CUC08_Gglean002374 [Alternaria sp. MG1]